MSDYSDIDIGNGEFIRVAGDGSTDGQAFYLNGERLIYVDEDALDVFASKTGATLTELDEARTVLTGGSLNPVAGLSFITDAVFSQIDAQNLKVGAFPEAQALTEAYLENFYKSGADQVERVYHGIHTGKTVAGETMAAYLDSDGNVAADITAIEAEFSSTDTALTESDLTEIQEQHGGTEPAGEDEPPTLL